MTNHTSVGLGPKGNNLERQGDLVSRLKTPVTHIETLVILTIHLYTS